MEKEIQDLAWKCLSKEARDKIRIAYKSDYVSDRGYYPTRGMEVLQKVFGHHNLISDEEPSELLHVEREKVVDWHSKLCNIIEARGEMQEDYSEGYYRGQIDTLQPLFGNKCLPDIEPIKIDAADSLIAMAKDEMDINDKESSRLCDKCANESYDSCKLNIDCDGTLMPTDNRESCDDYKPKEQPSVQSNPKFKIGDKVIIKSNAKDFHQGDENGYAWLPNRDKYVGKVYRIKEIWKKSNVYILDFPELITWTEIDLEPYTEPKFKIGDKVRVLENAVLTNERGKIATIIKEGQCCMGYGWVLDISSKLVFLESELEHYTELETKDNMKEKEKELNLCELLKDCEGEEFYSLMHGKVRFMIINADGFVMFDLPESFSVYDNGKYDLNAEVIIYPSRALYEKYPLDAYLAWMEWKSERTPKRWRAEYYKPYWYLDRRFIAKECTADANSDFDKTNYENGNMFRTEEEAKQAAEVIIKCLMKFHENYAKQ